MSFWPQEDPGQNWSSSPELQSCGLGYKYPRSSQLTAVHLAAYYQEKKCTYIQECISTKGSHFAPLTPTQLYLHCARTQRAATKGHFHVETSQGDLCVVCWLTFLYYVQDGFSHTVCMWWWPWQRWWVSAVDLCLSGLSNPYLLLNIIFVYFILFIFYCYYYIVPCHWSISTKFQYIGCVKKQFSQEHCQN